MVVGLILVPVLAFVVLRLAKYIGNLIQTLQQHMGGYTSIMKEIVTGIEAVKIFSKEKEEHTKFVGATKEYLKTDVKVQLAAAATRPVTEFFTISAFLGVVGYGGFLVTQQQMAFDVLWGFILFLLNLAQPIGNISNMVVNMQKARGAGKGVFAVIDLEPEAKDAGTRQIDTVQGEVVFDETRFRYAGDSDFELGPISFRAAPGDVAAFVGMSGGGKSTLVNMIPRLIRPTGGKMYLDGVDFSELDTAWLRTRIGMVSQESILFYGSIADNIRYGKRDADDAVVIEAAKIANAHNFIMELPKGYETQIGERGVMLSGGQRQRIALARAIIRNPDILILDEATSALDTESEMHIQEALARIIGKQTTFVIAHRLSTIKHANRIFVIENGNIIEAGTHDELMEADGKYRKLYSLQFR
jgi:subfamily B ATP-binding cassette protein MsbA